MGFQAHLVVLLGAALLVPGTKAGILYADPGPITPIKNNKVSTTAIVDEMHFEMDLIVHSFPTSGWMNVFCIGSQYMPSLWIHHTSDDDGGSYEGWWLRFQNNQDQSLGDEPLVVNKQYHFEMDWTQSYIWVRINNRTVWDKAASSHTNYASKEIWISHNSWTAADVTITNFVVSTDLSCWATGYECGDHLECYDDGTCGRDCEEFPVDEWLLDCSDEYDQTGATIGTMQADIEAINSELGIINSTTHSIQADIGTLNSTTDSLQEAIDAINNRLDRVALPSAAHAAPAMVDGVGQLEPQWTIDGKDLAIAGLFAVNLVIVAALVIACKTGSRGKYVYSN